MSGMLVDVMLHLDQSLDAGTLETVRKDLLLLEGVVIASNHPKIPYLMTVQYNSSIINPVQLLNNINNNGYHCEIVGL